MMPERPARQHQALVVEPAHQHPHAAAHLAQHVLRRHLAVLEDQLAGVRAAHAELVELLGRAEAREALLDDEGRDAACGPAVGVGLGIDDQDLGLGAVGDPHLAAVEDEAVALLLGPGAHRDHVRAGAGLAHRQRPHMLAARSAWAGSGASAPRCRAAELVDAEIASARHRKGPPRPRRGSPPPSRWRARDSRGRRRHRSSSTVTPRRPSSPSRGQSWRGKLLVAVDLGRDRQDLAAGEVGDRVADRLGGVAEIEVDRWAGHLGHCRLASRIGGFLGATRPVATRGKPQPGPERRRSRRRP